MNSNIDLSIQPAYSADGKTIEYAEVLIRMYKQITGVDKILQYVEDTHTEIDFDIDVLDETINYIEQYPGIAYPIGMNICGKTIGLKGVGDAIADRILYSNIEPSKLVIEINEKTDFESNITHENIDKIKATGVLMALDDFGVKNANIVSLIDNKFDILKVDKTFIDLVCSESVGEEHEKSKRTILQLISDMCSKLKIKSLVEGVETKEQLDIVRKYGYDLVQGYIYCKPIPMKEYMESPHLLLGKTV